jgi:TonB family protein
MNAPDLLVAALGSHVAVALGWTLVHSLWQCLLLGLLFMLAERVTGSGSAALRYWLGMTVLGSMLVCMAITFVLVHEAGTGVPAGTATLFVAAGTGQGAGPATLRSAVEPLVPWGALCWLVGVVLHGARLIGDFRELGRITAGARPLPEPWPAIVDRLRDQLGIVRAVRVLESVRVGVPIVAGWLRPVIIVPPSAMMGLTPRQLELIIGHELAHVARLDYLFNFGQLLVETLLFFHPAVHYVSRRVRQEREHCCDDAVVARTGETLAYARALAEIEGLRCSRGLRPAPAATGGQLSSRISRLVALRANGAGVAGWLAAMTVLAVIAGAIPGGARLAAEYASATGAVPATQPPAIFAEPATPRQALVPAADRGATDRSPTGPWAADAGAETGAAPGDALTTAPASLRPATVPVRAREDAAPDPASGPDGARPATPPAATARHAAVGLPPEDEGTERIEARPGPAPLAPSPGSAPETPGRFEQVTPTAGPTDPVMAAVPAAVAAAPAALEAGATSPPAGPASAAPRVGSTADAVPASPSAPSIEDGARSAGIAPALPEDGAGPTRSPSAATPATPAAPVTTGGALLRSPPPSYPRRARTRGIEGEVTVRYDVDERGRVESVAILSSAPGRTFDAAVRRAVRKWRHEPFMVEGQPVAASITRTFEFAIRGEALTADASDADGCRRVTGSRLCRSRNAYAELGVVVVLNPR